MKINNIKIKIKRDEFVKKLGIKNGEPGKPGKDYILTNKDKQEIASKINVPVVEKVIEKTEVIKEVPIVDEEFINKTKGLINNEVKKISWDKIKNKPDILQIARQAISAKTYSLDDLDNVNIGYLIKDDKGKYILQSQDSHIGDVISVTGNVVDNTDPANPIINVDPTPPLSSYETIAKNLNAYPFSINISGDIITSIVYTLPGGSITKTFNYTGDKIDNIVLTGDLPDGIETIKTFNYTGDIITSITYS